MPVLGRLLLPCELSTVTRRDTIYPAFSATDGETAASHTISNLAPKSPNELLIAPDINPIDGSHTVVSPT